MWEDWKAVLGVLAITFGLRVLDYIAPKGHHNRWLKSYAEKDEEQEETKDES